MSYSSLFGFVCALPLPMFRCGELKVLKDQCEFKTDEAGRKQRKLVQEAEVRSYDNNVTHACACRARRLALGSNCSCALLATI
eukprot:6194296-Pleurochrysis_carterae.AAC.1